jgi:GGDEF domain-containing protein
MFKVNVVHAIRTVVSLHSKMEEVLARQEQLEQENRMLRSQVESLSTNPNFGCYVRGAMEMQVSRRIEDEGVARALIALDVAGMGLANSRERESWVNGRIAGAIKYMRENLRSTDQICGQLNSGDEFIILCPLGDVERVMEKVTEAFNLYHLNPDSGLDPCYCAWVEYDYSVPFSPRQGSPNEDANTSRGMAEVYKLKAIAKAAKAK